VRLDKINNQAAAAKHGSVCYCRSSSKLKLLICKIAMHLLQAGCSGCRWRAVQQMACACFLQAHQRLLYLLQAQQQSTAMCNTPAHPFMHAASQHPSHPRIDCHPH
jgi:hypothetical protein